MSTASNNNPSQGAPQRMRDMFEGLLPDADKLTLRRCNDGWMGSRLIRRKNSQ